MQATGALGRSLPHGLKDAWVRSVLQHTHDRPGQTAPSSRPQHWRSLTGLEPRVQMDMAGRTIKFLLDTGATYSVLTSFSGCFSQSCTVLGVTGKPTLKFFTPLLFLWDGYLFIHACYARMSQPPIGQDVLHRVGTRIILGGMPLFMTPLQLLILPMG